ncbi:homoprotocatechuate degradation operon regulator HpaR [Ruegeria pomeroyi]|uniref:Homoprotocatechuate degradation operon regulator HpaR n=1 Tax=Ruegeria pomeroyi TaxID=89184 RepID=A0A9Q3WKZ5_9RHOB|nr:homoprotocatechuate degradation operon regulator HpaR [Ruegeria pomeroyi]MCE8538011.1 homoprotocatechuate degradation operon regulator HpaR [Ruegeria pomeroyi]
MISDLPKTSRSLPIALLRARERVMRPVRAILMDVGITEQQWRVLRVLEEEGPQDPTRIADGACLLLPSLTRILQKLEEKQLISRQPDPDDGRKQVVSITQAGTQIIRDNLGASQAVFEAIQAQMGADRYELLLDLLNELHLDKTD